MPALRAWLFAAALTMLAAAAAGAAGAAAPASAADDAPLLLEVRLRQHQLADAMLAWPAPASGARYGNGNGHGHGHGHGDAEAALPLGELARLLTLAIRVDAAKGTASGYIVSEDHPFSVDASTGAVSVDGHSSTIDPRRLRREADDLYVPLALLRQWLPLDLSINLSSLILTVTPRVALPLEGALSRRERAAQSSHARQLAYADPGFPRQGLPYALAAPPFIDQTMAMNATRSSGSAASSSDLSYSAYATADLAAMQASLFTAWRQRHSVGVAIPGSGADVRRSATETALRLTLARIDPAASLLGPLHARSIMVGSVPVAGVDHISLTAPVGNGVLVANRPLAQSSSFDRHSLQGDLAPGWDVELFYNEALIGYQAAREDGRYSFDDLALAYGPNEFRLVFHGPLGQLRVEKHSFLLEQSAVEPGQLYYLAAVHRSPPGSGESGSRALLRVDAGVLPNLSASAALVRIINGDGSNSYAELALHAYLRALIASVTAARSDSGGRLGELSLKTRIGGFGVSASRAVLDDFYSDIYRPVADPVRLRDEARVEGAALAMPVSLQARRDTLASGRTQSEAQVRLSWFRDGAAWSNTLRWQALAGVRAVDGNLGLSVRRALFGLSAQLQYGVAPRRVLNTASIAADVLIGPGLLAGAGLTRQFADLPGRLRLNGTLNGVPGRTGVALGLNVFAAGGAGRGREFGLGLRLFSAIGFEPRQAAWRASPQPMAASGAASVRVFIDENQNGAYDPGEPLVAGAALTINGARHSSRTDAAGVALLERLPVNMGADLAIDSATLTDPRWVARAPGLHIVPRPGVVAQIDLAVAVSGDIDGTVWLPAGGKQARGERTRGAAIEVRLRDRAGAVIARTSSGADGYYLFPTVLPGDWQVEAGAASVSAVMNGEGDSLHIDVEGGPAPPASQAGAPPAAAGI